MNLFITGATGFIGRNLIKSLMVRDFGDIQATLYVRDPDKLPLLSKKSFSVIKGTIEDQNRLIDALSYDNYDTIIHLAALTNDQASYKKLKEINADGTKNVINAIKRNYPKVKPHLVHISSSGVYGKVSFNRGLSIDEQTPLNPFSNYQKSKALAEKYLLEARKDHSLKVTIIRPPNVIGPGDFVQFYKIYIAIKEGKFPLINNGKANISYVDVDDLIKAIFLVINNPSSNGKIYNVKSFDITI